MPRMNLNEPELIVTGNTTSLEKTFDLVVIFGMKSSLLKMRTNKIVLPLSLSEH